MADVRNTDPQLKVKLQRLETQKRAALDSEAGHPLFCCVLARIVSLHIELPRFFPGLMVSKGFKGFRQEAIESLNVIE